MAALREFHHRARQMGSSFEFIIIAGPDGEQLLHQCVTEVERIEALLTEFHETSQTSLINRNAGVDPVLVNEEVAQLIERCIRISEMTQGAFDISASLLKRLYNFKTPEVVFPTTNDIRKALERVGSEKIDVDNNHVFLQVAGMHIGFGGVGKGYAADKVKALMMKQGVQSGVINASGDLTAWGTRLDGSPWRVGIADPAKPEQMLFWLPVKDFSVATSGDYEQYFVHGGKRYSHTIDPKTAKPVTGVQSVTVISPSAELSDALATAVFVMGHVAGQDLIRQVPGAHAILINDENKVFTSERLDVILEER